MTDDLEHKEPATEVAASPEPWSVWWSRLVQVAGLAIMGWQTFAEHSDRQWLLLCAMGMMLGEIGLRALFRLLLRASGGG